MNNRVAVKKMNIKELNGEKFRREFDKKKEQLREISKQLTFLKLESLDLTEEISRLVSEIELKKLYEM
jgi:hypothetical protein